MYDLISRQAVLKVLEEFEKQCWEDMCFKPLMSDARVIIKDLPAVQPKQQIPRKLKFETLEGMIQGYSYMDKCCVCPSCGEFRGNLDYEPFKVKKYSFCPDCGQALDWSDIP